MADDERPFLARWSQRKAQARSAVLPAEPATVPVRVTPPLLVVAPPAPAEPETQAVAPPPLTMDDVAALTHASDYSRFVAPGVAPGVSNAAMKKLFSDPHFNVMDGLDIYVGDYSQPDPIPPEMLRKMVQSKFLGLFDDEETGEGKDEGKGEEKGEEKDAEDMEAASRPNALPGLSTAVPGAADNPVHDDHTDLQLQPDDAAGRSGPDQDPRPREI